MKKILFTILFWLFFFDVFAQQFSIGEEVNPNTSQFKPLGASTKTGVYTYKYLGKIYNTLLNRDIGEIIIGVKNGHITMALYNLIPLPNDLGVPKSMRDDLEKEVGFPLGNTDGTYGLNLDNMTISLSRTNSVLTSFKDRIMFITTIKHSLLTN